MSDSGRMLGGVAAGMGALTLVGYMALILNEGDDRFLEVAPWAVAMAAASVTAAAGAATGGRRFALVAGVIFVAIGFPAIFSVGLPLIVAGLLCLVGRERQT